MNDPLSHNDLFEGLQALAKSAFPKRCSYCGRVYHTAEQFLEETKQVRSDSSGLKQVLDEGLLFLEVYRNCACGSTLMDFFSDRRDASEAGNRRRQLFAAMLAQLIGQGVSKATAHSELLKLVRHEKSALIEAILLAKRDAASS